MSKLFLHVVAARPNFMKAAPVIKKFEKECIPFKLVHTGQHYDNNMSNVFFEQLGLRTPDINLNIGGGDFSYQIGNILIKLKEYIEGLPLKPTAIIVYGDVNSTVSSALVSKMMQIDLIHIESGLRSYDNKMPEEINRLITDRLSNYLFVTSQDCITNLNKEGIEDNIYFVGNTMIDSLVDLNPKIDSSKILQNLKLKKSNYVVVTLHRPSNVDDKRNLENILNQFQKLSKKISVVFPVHPRIKETVNLLSNDWDEKLNIIVTDPLPYFDFIKLLKNASLVITDSGGIQEEATFFGVQCLTLRDNTERPITIYEGTNKLIGSDPKKIIKHFSKISIKAKKQKKIIKFWDGKASNRIIKKIKLIYKI